MVVTYKSFEAGVLDWIQNEFLSNFSGGIRFAMSAAVVANIPVVRDWYSTNLDMLKATKVVNKDGSIETSLLDSILKQTFSMNDNCVRTHIPLIRTDVTIRPDDVTKIIEYIEKRGAGDGIQRDASSRYDQ